MLKIRSNQSLKEFSTFEIGGEALFFVTVFSLKQMQKALSWAKEEKIPFFVLGKGSNLLFDDKGFEGLVIHNRIEHCFWEGEKVKVGSGYSFALLGIQSAKRGFSGLEFAAGVPGSVGGAIFMNAGAHNSQTQEVLQEVSFLSQEGQKETYKREEMQFSYRFSSFQKKRGVILEGVFALKKEEGARQRQRNWIEKRMKEQPLKEKSAGCIFRNPKEGPSAAFLIETSGLKGLSIGKARISQKHANFIVNEGGASSEEVLALIALVQERVKQEKNIFLEAEVCYVPYRSISR